MKTNTSKTSTHHTNPTPAQSEKSSSAFFGANEPQHTPFFPIQPKLTIGQPNDKYEQEADTVADRVVREQGQTVPNFFNPTSPPAVQTQEDENNIQRKPIFESPGVMDMHSEADIQGKEANSTPSSNFESQLSASKGGGSPLPEDTRTQMESGIGADFSGVRVHTGSNAAQMNQDIGAQAFTHGSDVYFDEGKYDTGSSGGQHLLAHELTHTVQQGAAVQRKVKVNHQTSPKIQRGAIEWIKGKIADGLNWLAEKLIPGYSLLNVILGKNLITDKAVPRTGQNIIKGYMELLPIIGSILFNELRETESLNDASLWVEQQVATFNIDFNQISKNLSLMWDELSIWNRMKTNVGILNKYVSLWLNKFLAFSSVVQEKCKALRLEGALRLVGAHQLLEELKKSPKAMKRVIDDPKLILGFFMDALKQGFQSFKDNFGMHFKNALFGWLFGKAAEMGVTMPKQFNIASLFGFIAQILGVTYQQIRAIVVRKLGPKGEMIISKLEQTAEIVIDVMTRGPIALWERIKQYLANLKEMLFSKITDLVTGEIIKSAVTKLLSMLNPAGAIVQLALTIYRVVSYFIEWWDTIKQIASGILSSITKVALGSVGGAAKFIEKLFASGMKLIIAFLAKIFGLGGIAKKVKVLLKRISEPVQNAIDVAVGWIIEKGKAVLAKLRGEGKAKDGDADNIKYTDVDRKKGLAAFENEQRPYLKDSKIKQEDAQKVAIKVKKKHPVFKSISVIDGGKDWDYEYVQRATADGGEKAKDEDVQWPVVVGDNIKTPGSSRIEKVLKIDKIADTLTFSHFKGAIITISYAYFIKQWNSGAIQKRKMSTEEFKKELTRLYGTKVANAILTRRELAENFDLLDREEAHHIIPVEVLKKQGIMQELVKSGWNFNQKINGIPIDKELHGSHRKYNGYVMRQVERWVINNSSSDVAGFKSYLETKLMPSLETHIEKAKSKSITLNTYFENL